MKWALAVVLAGCATLRVQPGELDASDTDCGLVGPVDVRLRTGVDMAPAILSCSEAKAAVARTLAREPVDPGWTVEFTMGYPGWGLGNDGHMHPTLGTTYPGTHVIEVSAVRTDVLAHELHHAAGYHGHLGWPWDLLEDPDEGYARIHYRLAELHAKTPVPIDFMTDF